VLYDPAWLSLLDARERLKARGHEAAEAETAICLALGDRKLKWRPTTGKVTYAPTGATLAPSQVRELAFREGVKLRLEWPFNLKPEEIDWDNSRPKGPWPYRPWQLELLAHVVRIEVSREDFDIVFPVRPDPAETASQADEESPPVATRKQERRDKARLVIAELHPDGVPGADELPNKSLVADVTARAKEKKWDVGSPDTILRAAGRK
jgi:hypothetical protein